MPHVSIKHFPAALTDAKAEALSTALTTAVTEAFGCPAAVVSVALEPVPAQEWTDRVYQPEITERAFLLIKKPGY